MVSRLKIQELIDQELKEANEKYSLFHSPHEAYAVLAEEVEECYSEVEMMVESAKEMWEDVKNDECIEGEADVVYAYAIAAIQEIIQVAAMCEKIKMSKLYEQE